MTFHNDKEGLHPEDKRNYFIFFISALLVVFLYDSYVIKPSVEEKKRVLAEQESLSNDTIANLGAVEIEEEILPRHEVLASSPRIKISNGRVDGSISLKGGRIDDLSLHDYYRTLEKKKNVVLFSPAGTAYPKYAEFGWLSSDQKLKLPDKNSVWQVKGSNKSIAQEGVTTLFWDNGQGLLFERELSLDEDYMFTIRQRVINKTGNEIKLHSFGLITEHGLPEEFEGRWVVHEGPLAYIGDELVEKPYQKIHKDPVYSDDALFGWIGLSEKYWFSSLIPTQGKTNKFRFVYSPPAFEGAKPRFQVDVLGGMKTVAPGESAEVTTRLFAGAKEIKLLDRYEKELGIKHFDLAVDFGLYYFMTKPFFYILTFFGSLTGNFGIAIIILTFIVRIAVFPLANTSFRSFAKMKQIAPQMTEIREKYGDDKVKLQQALVKLYEKEKVNPMAGCFPLLLQIPIFFALFKVLSVTIEMRHAPFFGWIDDMSVQDPTSLFNLFGLLPYDVPTFLMIGAWPCLMLFFMLLQRQLNPPPQDPTQAFMVNVMPFFITYILSKFASGLVIYWTLSNALSVLQQYVLMRSMGVEVHLFRRSPADKKMEKMVKEGPNVHPELEVVEDEIEHLLHKDEDESKNISPPKPKKKKKKR
jgi:YidC/Oxa1 family membrane protein insertase